MCLKRLCCSTSHGEAIRTHLSIRLASDLQDLSETCGPAEALNSSIFRSLQSAITESPGEHASAYLAAGHAKSATTESAGSDFPVSAFQLQQQPLVCPEHACDPPKSTGALSTSLLRQEA